MHSLDEDSIVEDSMEVNYPQKKKKIPKKVRIRYSHETIPSVLDESTKDERRRCVLMECLYTIYHMIVEFIKSCLAGIAEAFACG